MVIDVVRVEEAIRVAEAASAIEVRVGITGFFWGNADRAADHAFARLGMAGTTQRSGVLFLVVPWRRRVVVRADEGVTSHVDPSFWKGLVAAMTPHFRERRYTDGLVTAIEMLGRSLAPFLPPPGAGDRNELPDAVVKVR
jgi:uncharacterized membrane protein